MLRDLRDHVRPCATHTAVWAVELIRHSNRQPVQSRDTAAIFLVYMAEWVRLGHNRPDLKEGDKVWLLYKNFKSR